MTAIDADKQTKATSIPLSELPFTTSQMHSLAQEEDSDWQYEEGPRGADRWRNTDTGDLVWSRPGGAPEAPSDGGEGAASVSEADLERGREQAAQLADTDKAGVFIEDDSVADAVSQEGGKFFAAVDETVGQDIIDTQGGLYDYEDDDSATVASVDSPANTNWFMDVNAAKLGDIGGTIQHELGHVLAKINGYELSGGANDEMLPAPVADDDEIEARQLTSVDGDFKNTDGFDDLVEDVNEAFTQKRQRAREIQEDVSEDAEGTDQYQGMAFLEAESPSDRAYAFVDANEFLAETVRTITGGDRDKHEMLRANYPDVYESATEVFDVVPGDNETDETEPVVGEVDDDDEFTTYEECVEVNGDKEDPESYCAVIFGFDEPPDDDEEAENDGDVIESGATPQAPRPITVEATPEGVPDNAEYVPPGADIPEDAEVHESNQGGTYIVTDDSGTGDDDGDADFEDVPDAGPSEFAGGIAAAIDDTRDDFHDIRNAVTRADTREDAREILEAELTPGELEDALAEVERQEQMREAFDVVDDAGDLKFGQEILYDADRPKRGTVDDIDADGTVWIQDPERGMRSGVNPDFGTIYADPDYQGTGDDEPFTAEPGRYGLASNPDVLENAFEAADEVKGSREAGIRGGNTTGDKMKVLEMDDGSRVYATPVDAYPGNTGVVRDQQEARENNLQSPEVIEALGGTAAQTRLVEGPDGREYIAKEGVDGDTVAEYADRGGRASDAIKESAADTMTAAYFVGNMDLHGGNMVVNYDSAEVAVIDHDSAGTNYSRMRGVEEYPDISRYDSGPPGIRTSDQNIREQIYETAQDIRSGEADLGVSDRSDHGEFAREAANKATRAAYVDPTYDLPEDQTPADLQFPPSGIESLEDFDDPNDVPDESYPVVFVDGAGDKPTGELLDVQSDEGQLIVRTDNDVHMIEDINRVVEVL